MRFEYWFISHYEQSVAGSGTIYNSPFATCTMSNFENRKERKKNCQNSKKFYNYLINWQRLRRSIKNLGEWIWFVLSEQTSFKTVTPISWLTKRKSHTSKTWNITFLWTTLVEPLLAVCMIFFPSDPVVYFQMKCRLKNIFCKTVMAWICSK